MQIYDKRIDEIKPYENNPRHNDNAVDAVANSIREFGFKVPIVVDSKGVIVAGHTRYKALKALEYDEIPCLICENLTEEQKKKYRYLDNKTGEKATWDLMKLEVELEGVDLEGFDFFGMAEDFTVETGAEKTVNGSREFDTEVFGDEEFKYECPKCGFRFN